LNAATSPTDVPPNFITVGPSLLTPLKMKEPTVEKPYFTTDRLVSL
jgi:hypothetical protein